MSFINKFLEMCRNFFKRLKGEDKVSSYDVQVKLNSVNDLTRQHHIETGEYEVPSQTFTSYSTVVNNAVTGVVATGFISLIAPALVVPFLAIDTIGAVYGALQVRKANKLANERNTESLNILTQMETAMVTMNTPEQYSEMRAKVIELSKSFRKRSYFRFPTFTYKYAF